MVTERIERYWIVKTNGAEQLSVRPGSSVEIGRRPLRPLSDDGFTRWEIVDDTRSMSKRHAIVSVQEQGTASVRDLNSTNGSYIVGEDGVLKRLEAGVDFLLPGSPVRMQFGDVPVDFIRVDEPAASGEQPAPKVSNLFDYAADDAKQEPDVSDMSVDDILNLRAGEPTTAFHRDSVARRLHEFAAAASTSYPPHSEQPADVKDDDGSSEDSVAAETGDDIRGNAVDGNATDVNRDDDDDAGADDASAKKAASAEEDAHPVERLSLNVVQGTSESIEERDLFVDALSATDQDTSPSDDQAEAGHPQKKTDRGDSEPGSTDHEIGDVEVAPAQQGGFDVRTSQVFDQVHDSPAQVDEPTMEEEQGVGSAMVADRAPDATAAFTPVFEPGSVFDKVAHGEFKKREPAVQVDGLTSDQAKTTTDFTEQFKIARYPQLLPFLAMNPSLYDDLYAWLAAQGSKDIDAALAKNAGYDEYRKAVGK